MTCFTICMLYINLSSLAAITNVLNQGNLSPELKEKLVNMRTKQEQQNSQNLGERTPAANKSNSTNESASTSSSRRRTASRHNNNDDDEWKVRTPSKRHHPLPATSQNNNSTVKSSRKSVAPLEDAANLSEPKQTQLERHKDLLKKSILRKRSLLERNLQNEIREEVEAKTNRHVRAMSATTPEKPTTDNERTSVFTERLMDQNTEHKRLVVVYTYICSIISILTSNIICIAVTRSLRLRAVLAQSHQRCTAGTVWADPRRWHARRRSYIAYAASPMMTPSNTQ